MWRFRSYALVVPVVVLMAVATSAAAPVAAEPGSQGWLHAMLGSGSGRVLISPTAQEAGEFYAQGEVEVEGTSVSTAMAVTRALFTDQTCATVSKGWAAVAPGTLTTDVDGAGAMHFVRDTPQSSGTTFFTEFRVAGGGSLLQSDCITVLVK